MPVIKKRNAYVEVKCLRGLQKSALGFWLIDTVDGKQSSIVFMASKNGDIPNIESIADHCTSFAFEDDEQIVLTAKAENVTIMHNDGDLVVFKIKATISRLVPQEIRA